MRSHTTVQFREQLAVAPEPVRSKAEAAYRLWQSNPSHPSLRFKKVHTTLPIFSVRIDIDWRAVGTLRGGEMVWFWIGPHKHYERLLDSNILREDEPSKEVPDLEELQRRIEAYRSGELQAAPGDQAMARARQRIRDV